MITSLLIGSLLLGLAGSLHCLGMCGPLAILFHGSLKKSRSQLPPALVYHGGRILVYVVLGTIFGQIGYLLDFTGYQHILSKALGGLLLVIAGLTLWKPGFFKRLTGPLTQWAQSTSKKGHTQGWFIMGIVNGLLPCGLVLAALAAAIQPGSWWLGGASMAAFGLGTMPLLIVAGYGSKLFKHQRVRPLMKLVSPLIIIATGAWLIMRGTPSDDSCCPEPAPTKLAWDNSCPPNQ